MVITTNYDTLIEDAFTDSNGPMTCSSIRRNCPPTATRRCCCAGKAAVPNDSIRTVSSIDGGSSQGGLDFSRTIIFKMHGSLWPTPDGDAFVITEEDYLEFLSSA